MENHNPGRPYLHLILHAGCRIYAGGKMGRVIITAVLCAVIFNASQSIAEDKKMKIAQDHSVITLPPPAQRGRMSLEEALSRRESVRDFSSDPLTKEELSQLLWSAQGKTRNRGARTSPSAGALFPLEIHVAVKEGVFHYSPANHRLERIKAGDIRSQLAAAALGQESVREAPAVFVIAAVFERTAVKYGNRAERYVKMEAGHAAQNLLLQAVALGLGAFPIGAFYDGKVREALGLPAGHEPLYLIPAGKRFTGRLK